MIVRRLTLLLALCCSTLFHVQAQRFAAEIQAFKKQDSLQAPPQKALLFVGSSSIARWTDLQDYYPGKKVINRGFGGSTLLDLIQYADDVIFPYNPKQIIIYCGENDLVEPGVNVPYDSVVARFKRLYSLIREKLPKTPIIYISLKPSPSRRHLAGKMTAANGEIRDYLQFERNVNFVDVYYPMLDHGEPKVSLFLSDGLHMTAEGYNLWKRALYPYLR